MIYINLLPWREKRRIKQQRNFIFFLLTAAGIAAFLVITLRWSVNYEISQQRKNNQFIENKIMMFDKNIATISEIKAKQKELLDRIAVIQFLQNNRSDAVLLLSYLAKITPEKMTLHKIERNDNKLTITGQADSSTRVSMFMRGFDNYHVLGTPILNYIEAEDASERKGTRFALYSLLSFRPKENSNELE